MSAPELRVLFRAAAGPRLGFGHLIRCRSLARALGVTPLVSLRATARTHDAAIRLGFRLAADGLQALRESGGPCVLVVDDPSAEHAEVWVNGARRLGVPVATVHDLGLGYVDSDLAIDGSVVSHRASRNRRGDLRGPTYAMLGPDIVRWRERRATCVEEQRVLVALGGGSYIFTLAARLSESIADAHPGVRLRIAAGFSDVPQLPSLRRAEWVSASDGLGDELARATVALVAGGVTLYEACAIGTPAVATALTPAQGLTIRALAEVGAVLDGGSANNSGQAARLAAQVAHLLSDARSQRRLSAAGRRVIDGRGIFRVADRVRELARQHGVRHAA